MVFTSSYADLSVPEIDAASFVIDSERFQANPDKPASVDALTGKSLTFQQVHDQSLAFATGLKTELGLEAWSVVALYSANNIHYGSLVYGTLLAGCTVTTVNSTYTVEELLYQLKDSAASVLIVDKDTLANGLAAAEQAGIPAARVFVIAPEAIESVQPVSSLFSTAPYTKVEFTADELAHKPAYLTYSSGTTGKSKGVVTSHRNMVANVLQTLAFVDEYKIENDVWIGFLPFFHMYALQVLLHLVPHAGIPVSVMFKFDMLLFLKTMMTHKIRTALIVPPVALALARHPIVDKFDLSALSRVVTGAAPFPAAISEAITKRFGVISVQGYGLTETTPFISLCPLKEPVHGSIGVLAPNIEARIVDAETGKDVGAGEAGELWVRGPNVMVGYHNNAEATAASIDADGYFHTGDVAIISAEGYLTIVDRLKELIKYGGLQVAPAELEAKLLSYPKIADAAVIGCPDEAVGELPLAFVVMHPGQTATEAEIQTFIAGQVAQHKQLRGGVVLIDAIPRAASGKILRRVLREKLSVALAATKTA